MTEEVHSDWLVYAERGLCQATSKEKDELQPDGKAWQEREGARNGKRGVVSSGRLGAVPDGSAFER